jgi:hypothetical protein
MSYELNASQVAALEAHPLSTILPPMTAGAFDALRADIAANGQRSALVLLDGKILDGRHRARALVNLGRGARVVDFTGEGAREFVLSSNVQRRNLSSAQSAMIAARMVGTRHGAHAVEGELTQVEAANALNVSIRYVRDAQWLIANAPDLADEVFNGDLSLTAAMRRARPARVVADADDNVVVEPSPAIMPVANGADIIAAAIELMRTTDAGTWVNSLRGDPRSLILALDAFARSAYDVADESGMMAA